MDTQQLSTNRKISTNFTYSPSATSGWILRCQQVHCCWSGMVWKIIQFLCLEWSISVFYKLCSDVCSGRDVIQDNNDDLIHMGHAIVTFYSALIDLLGRCAPEMHVSVFSMSAAIQHSLMPDSIELSREKCQLPFCQLHNWKKYIRMCM